MNEMFNGGAPPPQAPLTQPGPTLADNPAQGSALGGKPVGLGEAGDSATAILQRAELLRKSGAITETQFQMIVAKLMAAGSAKPPVQANGMPPPPQQSAMPQPSPGWNV